MNSGTKIVGILLVAGVIIGVSIWLGRQSQPKPSETGGQATPWLTATGATASAKSAAIPRPANASPSSRDTNLQTEATQATAPTTATNAGLIADWNEKIDEALKSGDEERDVAKSLLKLFPRFPAEGQVEAVQHISNLLPDEDYAELGKLMEDAALPEDVLDQLIMDLLNRPNKIMLPELVKVARNPQHAKAGEAKDFLELYLEEDYGADWNLWQAKVDEWLKANPE